MVRWKEIATSSIKMVPSLIVTLGSHEGGAGVCCSTAMSVVFMDLLIVRTVEVGSGEGGERKP